MNSEIAGCRFVLASGVHFKNGSMRGIHYCKRPIDFSEGDFRCDKHAGQMQLYPRSIKEEDLVSFGKEWDLFVRMRARFTSIVARKSVDGSYFDFCHAADSLNAPGLAKLTWAEIVKNPGALAWLRDHVAKTTLSDAK